MAVSERRPVRTGIAPITWWLAGAVALLGWALAMRPSAPTSQPTAEPAAKSATPTPAPRSGEHPESDRLQPTTAADDPAPQPCMPLPGCATSELCADGCNRCRCELGSWECTRERCPDSPACPAAPPTQFSACDREGALCGGFGPCAPICQCDGEQWRCMDQPCSAGCPAREPPPPPLPRTPRYRPSPQRPAPRPGTAARYRGAAADNDAPGRPPGCPCRRPRGRRRQ